MSLNSSSDSCRSSGPDFHLSDEILAVIPTDPYDQLDVARKITSMAIASRVNKLEMEMERLCEKVNEKDRVIVELQDKVTQLEKACHESELRLKFTCEDNDKVSQLEKACREAELPLKFSIEDNDKVSQLEKACHEAELRLKFTCEDNMKLTKERDSLAMTVKKMSRDLAKLETFKRQLVQSLSDDNSLQAETVDIGTYDQSTHKAYSVKEEVNSYGVHHSFSGSTDSTVINDDASKRALQRFSMTPNYITPRLTSTGTPKIVSTSVSPRRYSVAESPQRTSGANSPTNRQYDGRGSMSSFFPSSQQSSAANSPPKGRPLPGQTRIDGKEFFRQARSRLSYEQFSAFLTNIKELNAQKQSREETLRKAEEIFGTTNKDLYLLFQGLLNRSAR